MEAPAVLLVMGVSGSGKSTVGALLASKLGWKFYDADDYHSEENRMKMGKGIPLTDQDSMALQLAQHFTKVRSHLAWYNPVN
ncbi:probable gluconokinase isoform X1 [Cricetulus griseus]|uniref:probable gluconokinase isoform X1 n=1 Tax=Cricetulus griseus TaxID=10029 RepID=UPI0007DAAD5A|nr:probable gluconokinase isoform X1 [Cricetulus griseus]